MLKKLIILKNKQNKKNVAIRLHKIKGSSIGHIPNQPKHKKFPTKNQKKN
jgi:hypothetical protein